MIYICDFNSALDYKINLDLKNQKLESLNRFSDYHITLGGKGINNALLFANLKTPVNLIGFNGGFVGKHIRSLLQNHSHINYHPITVKENNRINVKLSGIKIDKEIEINGAGPLISEQNCHQLLSLLSNVKKDDVVILAGSKPQSEIDLFAKISEITHQKQALLVVDTNKKILVSCLKFKPFLIKPNHFELEQFFATKIDIEDEARLITYCQKLITKGAQNVLLSLGDKGALLVSANNLIWRLDALPGKVVNTVGGGDSMVAGFVKKYLETQDLVTAFCFASACGSATVFSKGIATEEQIVKYFEKLQSQVRKVK